MNKMTISKIAYNQSATADTAIFDAGFSSGYLMSDISVVYLWITPQAAGVLTLIRTKGETDYEEKLNSGCTLEANCAYMFPIMISEDTLNIKYSVDTTMTYVQFREMF